MNRRDYLSTCGLAVLGFGVQGTWAAADLKRPKRILFLMTDQHRPDGLGLFGDPYAKTPVLDRLAQEGMALRKTYTQYPLCVPARTSIILGRYAHSISSGVWGNSIVNATQTSFLELLQAAGWKTACFGKLHIHQRNQKDWTTLDELKKWKAAEKIAEAKYLEPFRVSQSPQLKPKIVSELPYGAPSPYKTEAHYEWRVKEAVIAYMKEHKDESWFLQCSFTKPHPPLNPPQEYWDKFKDVPFVLPAYPKDDLADTALAGKMDEQGVGSPTNRQVRDAMIGYYACLNFCDALFGEVLAALDELGMRDDTFVVYTSDHGEMLWDHRLWHKNVFFEQAVRVPFIFRLPGLVPPGQQSAALVEHIDLLPTVCELAGIPAPSYAQGKSLVPVLSGQSTHHKDRVYSECYYWGDHAGKVAMMFDGRYKIIDNGEEVPCELYDLKMDPRELTNVSTHPTYAAMAETLLAELRIWRKKDCEPDTPGTPDKGKTEKWLGTVLEPLDKDESEYLVDAANLSLNSMKSKPGKWNRVLTVPAGSFAPNSTYELTLEWESKGLEEGGEFFALFAGDEADKKHKQVENWKGAAGESGTIHKTLATTDSDKWSLAVGVKDKGHLVVKRIRIRKK